MVSCVAMSNDSKASEALEIETLLMPNAPTERRPTAENARSHPKSRRFGPSAPVGGSALYRPGCHRSGRCRERVTSKKGRQTLRHAAGMLHLQQVRRGGKDEGLDVGQPREQQFLSLPPDGIQLLTPRPYDSKDRLGDATRVLPRERPLLQGGQFLTEEGVRVSHVLIE